MPLKYLSLFSGIGGFEVAIHNVFPDAICIGYSEVDKFAIKVYQHHFPIHENLGDITKITELDIERVIAKHGGCDLVVGGFPCQNLSSLSRIYKQGDSNGLNGNKSVLFYDMFRILCLIYKICSKVHFVIENNASMTIENQELITNSLKKIGNIHIFKSKINSLTFGVQRRIRLFWSTFNIPEPVVGVNKKQTWEVVLDPKLDCVEELCASSHFIKNSMNKVIKPTKNLSKIAIPSSQKNIYMFDYTVGSVGFTRWNLDNHSITYVRCTPITRHRTCLYNILLDTRFGGDNEFMIRYFSVPEAERLFFLPRNWVNGLVSPTQAYKLLGNTVVIKVVEYIINFLTTLSFP